MAESTWRSDANEVEPWPIKGPWQLPGYDRWAWRCNWCDTEPHMDGFRHLAAQYSDQHVFECPNKPAGFRKREPEKGSDQAKQTGDLH